MKAGKQDKINNQAIEEDYSNEQCPAEYSIFRNDVSDTTQQLGIISTVSRADTNNFEINTKRNNTNIGDDSIVHRSLTLTKQDDLGSNIKLNFEYSNKEAGQAIGDGLKYKHMLNELESKWNDIEIQSLNRSTMSHPYSNEDINEEATTNKVSKERFQVVENPLEAINKSHNYGSENFEEYASSFYSQLRKLKKVKSESLIEDDLSKETTKLYSKLQKINDILNYPLDQAETMRNSATMSNSIQELETRRQDDLPSQFQRSQADDFSKISKNIISTSSRTFLIPPKQESSMGLRSQSEASMSTKKSVSNNFNNIEDLVIETGREESEKSENPSNNHFLKKMGAIYEEIVGQENNKDRYTLDKGAFAQYEHPSMKTLQKDFNTIFGSFAPTSSYSRKNPNTFQALSLKPAASRCDSSLVNIISKETKILKQLVDRDPKSILNEVYQSNKVVSSNYIPIKLYSEQAHKRSPIKVLNYKTSSQSFISTKAAAYSESTLKIYEKNTFDDIKANISKENFLSKLKGNY